MTHPAAPGNSVTAAALALHTAGLSVIPASIDGTKSPIGQWKKYQHERMTPGQLHEWFDSGHPGIGIVPGAISGNLEMLELEGRAIDEGILVALTELAAAAGLGDLWRQLLTGYLEKTPSGGLHILYRVTDGQVLPNTKLARRPATQAELAAKPKEKVKVLIETRGEGGFVVVAPSHGTTHETGQPWVLLAGGPATIPTITGEQRDALHSVAAVLDQLPRPDTTPPSPFTQPALDHPTSEGGLSPGDDYEQRTDWADILTPHGWTLITSRGRQRYWRRPGKKLGISASTGAADDRDRLYVFTTSTEFEAETPYTKFGAYCVAPETKILTADLTWREAGSIKDGDELVGVDEHIPQRRGRRKLQVATVEATERKTLPCYRITLIDGRSIVCSDQHPWLAASAGKGGNMRWIETRNLRAGQRICSLTSETWEISTDFDSGWLSGILDGEGWATATEVGIAQKTGPVLERAEKLLRERGFNPAYSCDDRSIANLRVRTLSDILRLLGTLQPGRLIAKRAWVGRGAWTRAAPNALVAEVRFLGPQEVAAFMTNTRTFIAEGLVSHNTLLEYGGDHHLAAKTLHSAGYGRPAPEPARPTRFTQPASEPATGRDDTPGQPAGPAAHVDEPLVYTRTDDGNALRLIDAHAHQIRYCPERGMWLCWNGHRWRWDQAGHVQELARAIARNLPDNDRDDRTHRLRTLHARGLTAMTHVARTDPRIVAPIGDLDARPYQLNTPAGLVDLRTGQLQAADPAALCARSTSVAPDFDMRPERWLRFLAQTFAGDTAMTVYVQRLIGLSLVGTVLEQLLPFPYGSGANGKSTLMGALMRVLGIGDDGYAVSAPAELLLATAHADHPTEIARLAGTRLVVTSELEDGQKFAEARVKLLTGGDPIAARFMRGDYFTFVPTHTIWMPGNHQPAVRTGGPAFWRRLRLLPFLHIVPPEDREKGLETTLVETEGGAILAWAIRGAADYFTHGIEEPETVQEATAQYQADQDTIGRFIEEQCVTGSAALQGMQVQARDLRTSYEAWCHTEGETPVTVKAFSLALQRQWNVIVEKHGRGRTYRGIRLIDPPAGPYGREDTGADDDKIGGPGW